MKVGTFGGQIEALRREVRNIEKEERQRGNRRAFLGCVGGLAAGAVGLLGFQGAVKAKADADEGPSPGDASKGPATKQRATKQPDRMKQLATGPLPQLISERWAFLHHIESGKHSEAMVIGLSRLVHVAIERTPEAEGDMIGRYILGLKPAQLPPAFEPLLRTLKKSRATPKPK